MVNIKEKNPDKVYVKHHSFENFRSSIGSDIAKEQQRAIRLLKAESKLSDVQKNVLNDLLDPSGTALFKITQHIADELSRIDDINVGRYVSHRYRYDVFPKKKIIDSYPPYLQIEPTSVCNYRCVFCYQTDESFSNRANGFMGSMTYELFKEVIDQAQGNIEFFSLASRGEPLICKDIDKMLKYCVGKFLGLKINTNASLLNEKLCHTILEGGVNTIVFSADAAVEPLYSQLRVKGSLEKVLSNIRMFRDIKAKHYPKSKIITRVSGVKVNDSQEMAEMFTTWGELVEQLAFVVYNPWENVYETKPNAITESCSDLWRRMFVWYDGKVNPCDTDYKSLLTVGNVKEINISKLWQSQAYDALRAKHLEGNRQKVFPCKGCVVL